jgi:hypothetical protein
VGTNTATKLILDTMAVRTPAKEETNPKITKLLLEYTSIITTRITERTEMDETAPRFPSTCVFI